MGASSAALHEVVSAPDLDTPTSEISVVPAPEMHPKDELAQPHSENHGQSRDLRPPEPPTTPRVQ